MHNDGNSDVTFNVAATLPQGSPHTIALDKTQIKVKAHGDADVRVTLNVPGATAGNSDAFRDVAGLIELTPTGGGNSGIALRLPYYLVPRVSSNVDAKLDKDIKSSNPNGAVKLSNKDSMIAATADFYSWGLEGKGKSSDKKNPVVNLASAGVQSFPGGGDSVIVFAVNTEEDGCRTPAAEHAGAGRRAGPRGAPAFFSPSSGTRRARSVRSTAPSASPAPRSASAAPRARRSRRDRSAGPG